MLKQKAGGKGIKYMRKSIEILVVFIFRAEAFVNKRFGEEVWKKAHV